MKEVLSRHAFADLKDSLTNKGDVEWAQAINAFIEVKLKAKKVERYSREEMVPALLLPRGFC